MICYFRVDAYQKIGTGHLVRSKIIADFLSANKGFRCVFLVGEKSLQSAIDFDVTYEVIDEDNELESICRILDDCQSPKILVTDGDKAIFYEETFQKTIVESNTFLMTVTMRNEPFFHSHLVFNQNIIALDQHYKKSDYTKLLLGPEYIILNENFRKLSPPERIGDQNKKPNLLINFGGADALDLTSQVLREVATLADQLNSVSVVVGRLYKPLDSLKHLIEALKETVDIQLFVNTPLMPQLMEKCDFAITSCGLTAWELIYLKTPNMVITTSDREKITAVALEQEGCIVNLGHRAISASFIDDVKQGLDRRADLFDRMSNSRVVIDGNGLDRLCDEVSKLFKDI